MRTSSTRVSSQYRVTLLQQIRKQLNIKSGDRLLMDVQDGMIVMLPLHKGYAESLAGYHREIWKSSADYVARERSIWIDSKI